ncbi:MAG: polysaccharide biosynthesis tyrosine autokinase [Rhodothermales bacterium]
MGTPLLESGNNYNPFTQGPKKDPLLTFGDLIQIVYRHKHVLIITTILFAALAVAYTMVTKPVYQANVTLKKEQNTAKGGPVDDFSRILFAQQAMDQIDTEAQLLTSRQVLESVVLELDLLVTVGQFQVPDLIDYAFDMSLAEYQHELDQHPESGVPRIKIDEYNVKPGFRTVPGGSYRLRVNERGLLELHDMEVDSLLAMASSTREAVFTLPHFTMRVDWPNPVAGSELRFETGTPERVVGDLGDQIDVENPPNTTLLRATVRSNSPYMAQLIANTLATSFQASRFEHKREAIRYSSKFIDDQLTEITTNLRRSEDSLSTFRGRNRITSIDEGTRETIEFITQLESEKVQTELELAQYESRYETLKGQFSEKGFFDQTYLTPQTDQNSNYTPFSTLLEQLTRAELERLELLQRRTPSHPDVIAIDERIAEIKSNLAEFNENTITAYDVIIKSLRKKRDNLNGLIRSYNARVANIASNEGQLMALQRERDLNEKMYLMLADKREEMRLAELSNVQDIIIVESAVLPIEPILPRRTITVLIGTVLGLLAGLTLVFLIEFQGKTIMSIREVEEGLMLPVLAIMPTFPAEFREKIRRGYHLRNHLDLLTDTRYGFKESYRMLRTKLSFTLSTKRSPTKNNILFTSCEEDTGKTTIVTNFSLLLALAGKRILVIDCDLKNPSVGRFFGIPFNAPGLIDFILHDYITVPDIYRPLEDDTYRDAPFFNPTIRMVDQELSLTSPSLHLDVIPAGGSVEHSSELLDSEKFKDFLFEISGSYDYVLIDTPPVTRTVDAMTIGSFIKNAVVIVRPGHTRKDNLSRAIQDFRQFNVHLLGSVINACDIKRFANDYGYGYGYGYNYRYESDVPRLPAAEAAS